MFFFAQIGANGLIGLTRSLLSIVSALVSLNAILMSRLGPMDARDWLHSNHNSPNNGKDGFLGC